MATTQISSSEKWTLTHLLKDTILHVCEVNAVYHGKLEIDGIICITGQSEGEQIVVKVHEQICPEKKTPTNNNEHQDVASLTNKRPREWMSTGMYKHRRLMQKCSVYSPLQKQNGNQDMKARKPSEPSDTKEIPFDSFQFDERYGKVSLKKSLVTGSPFHMLSSPAVNEAQPNSALFPFTNKPECKICGYIFESFSVLCEHNEAAHSAVTCRYCYKTFTSRSNLERHSRLHTGHKPYVCSICGKAFSRKDHLSNHATKHAFKCGTCSKRFPDKKGLVAHYSSEHNALLTNICAFCNKGFSCAETYEDHVKIHPQFMQEAETSSFPCRPASENSTTDASNSPLDLATKKYMCSLCSFSSNDRVAHMKHALIHGDVKPAYRCGACFKMFNDPIHYTDHLACHDDGPKIFECCLCFRYLSSFSELKLHEGSHFLDERDTSDHLLTCKKCFMLFYSSTQPFLSDSGLASEYDHMFCPRCYEDNIKVNYVDNKASKKDIVDREIDNTGRENKRKQKVPKSLKSVVSYTEDDVDNVDAEGLESYSNGEELQILPKSESPTYITSVPTTDNSKSIVEVKKETIVPEESKAKTAASMDNKPLYFESGQLSRSPGHSHESLSSTFASSPASPSNSQSAAIHSSAVSVSDSPRANIEIPLGPYPCSLCSNVSNTFQDLEMHCFSEHNRSPCMFCSKTFAQKANRDRHVCLHTGEKPYACPECSEKFSRGDKLKIHRIRAHKVQFPSYGSKSKDSMMVDMIGHGGSTPVSMTAMNEYSSGLYSSSVTADLSFQNSNIMQNLTGYGSTSSNSGLSYASGKVHVQSTCQESLRDDSDVDSKDESEIC